MGWRETDLERDPSYKDWERLCLHVKLELSKGSIIAELERGRFVNKNSLYLTSILDLWPVCWDF